MYFDTISKAIFVKFQSYVDSFEVQTELIAEVLGTKVSLKN